MIVIVRFVNKLKRREWYSALNAMIGVEPSQNITYTTFVGLLFVLNVR